MDRELKSLLLRLLSFAVVYYVHTLPFQAHPTLSENTSPYY